MRAGSQIMRLHLYSDATLLSITGAVPAYLLRMRIIDVNTRTERSVTVAYIPQVKGKLLETCKGQEARSENLQRVLLLTFRTLFPASHCGARMDLSNGGRVRISPLPLLYVRD